MRIDRLELTAFGPFTNVSIECARGVGLHVVFGPNEAGKSSALRAIGDLFFGIPTQTTDNFIHPYDTLKLRATISARDGQVLEFARRKGRSVGDLLDSSGRTLDRNALAPFLGGAERAFFERAFGLDPKRLAAGAMDLLTSGGDVGRAVLQATSGVSGLSSLLDSIEADAGNLFKERGKTQSVNARLSDLKALEEDIKRSRLSGETWRKLFDELESARADVGKHVRERTDVDVEQQRLSRIQRALPLVARRSALEATVASLAGVPFLPETFDAKAAAARDEHLRAVTAEESLVREVAALEADISLLPAPGALLPRGREIEAFYQECGTMHDFRKDLPTREGELRETTAQATLLAKDIAPGLSLDDVIVIIPPQTARKALRALATEERRLNDELSRQERDLAATREGIRDAREKLAALGAATQPAPLARAIREVERGGDPEEQLSKAELFERKSGKALGEALTALSGWAPRGADELAAISLPGDATIDAFQKRFATLDDSERELEADRKRLASETAAREADRRSLAAGRSLPTREAVGAARDRRTKGWKLVRKVYIEREADAESMARQFDPDRPLVEAFERSIDSADGAADQLVDAANDAARDAELSRQLQQIAERIAESARRAEHFASFRAALEAEWRAVWPDAGIAPRTPAEMKEWLRARERALDRLEAHRTTMDGAESARGALERARSSLLTALAVLRPEAVPSSIPYAEVFSLAEETLERLEKAASERKRLEARIEEATEKAASLDVSLSQTRAALERWKTSWSEGVKSLQRPATVSSIEVEAILDACNQLDAVAPKVASLRDRMKKMREGLEVFGAQVTRLCAVVAPDETFADPIAAAETLFERLQVERSADGKRAQAFENLEKGRGKLGKERMKAEAARLNVEALCRDAACESPQALPSRLEELKEKRRVRQELEKVEKELLTVGAGRSPHVLAAECAEVDGDTLPARLQTLDSERAHLDTVIGNLRKREGELESGLAAADDEESVAAKGQEAADLRARIGEDALRWLRLRASAFLLRQAIEAWRKENQDPLLIEATRIFSSLTKGRFVSLIAEVDEKGTPAIVAERAEGRHVSMAGLSDGTRDQLFLALRLASIRRYAREAEALPFIADDLLVSFDDARATAALKVLADFANDVQVILFTHHRHLVDLAKSTLPPGSYGLHELEA